ncbi:hypothetical protein BHE16_00295 [Neomicrococcus aestuarii]|uniref:LysM domain-containing protein n=1 Tax=Neomicrococcus aestuarii TaxID=556325 RepID=A0A1L2ZK64_9MICC|nr:hypothetical protein BHE16_00295 [Neomicrococcus aestuarii]
MIGLQMMRRHVHDLLTLISFLLLGGFFLVVGHSQLTLAGAPLSGIFFQHDAAAYVSLKDVEFVVGLACGTAGLAILTWLAVGALFGTVSVLAARRGLHSVSQRTASYTPRFMRSLLALVFGVSLLAAPGAFAENSSSTQEVPSPAFVSQSITVETGPASPPAAPSKAERAVPQAEQSPTPGISAETSSTPVQHEVNEHVAKKHEAKERESMRGIPAQHLTSVLSSGQRQSTADHQEITVKNGDSLWAIVSEHLGPQATSSEIHAAWPKWYERNRAVIGENPHVIVPGTVLINPNF